MQKKKYKCIINFITEEVSKAAPELAGARSIQKKCGGAPESVMILPADKSY